MTQKRETRKYKRLKQDAILRGLLEGLHISTVLGLVAVSKSTYYRWRRENAEFDSACEQAESEAIACAERTLLQAIKDGDVRTAQWFLERRSHVYRPAGKLDVLNESYRVVLEVADEGSDADYEIIYAEKSGT